MNLIISLREFLSSDATGSEGVARMKALPGAPYGTPLQWHSSALPAPPQQPSHSPALPGLFPSLLIGRQKQGFGVFICTFDGVNCVHCLCLLADCLLCA